jgi:hypothetical protein
VKDPADHSEELKRVAPKQRKKMDLIS